MPLFEVKSPLKHDKKIYKPGETVDLTLEEASRLVAGNVVVGPIDGGKKAKGAKE